MVTILMASAWGDLAYLALGVIALVIVLCLFAAPDDYPPAPNESYVNKEDDLW